MAGPAVATLGDIVPKQLLGASYVSNVGTHCIVADVSLLGATVVAEFNMSLFPDEALGVCTSYTVNSGDLDDARVVNIT